MNSLIKFVFTVSVLLAVKAAKTDVSKKSEDCPVLFPNGFFCNLVCQDWPVLNGNTVTCFISSNGEYHRVIGRNTAYGIWRFYKVDENADLKSLCKVSENGDIFFLNKTDVMCPVPDLPVVTLLPLDSITDTTEPTDIPQEDPTNSTSEPTPSSKRLSLTDLIQKINEEVAKLFKGKLDESDKAATETKRRAPRSALRQASPRSSTKKSVKSKQFSPMDDICHLITTDVCRQNKIITCNTAEDCCWAETDPDACKQETMSNYDDCYSGLSAILESIAMK